MGPVEFMSRWRWRGSVAMLAVAVGFVIYPLIESEGDVINSDWPAFATGARIMVDDPGHLYDFDVQRRVELDVTGGRTLVTLGINGILPFVAPAWVAFFGVPFELLGTNLGGRLWILFGLACLASGLYLAVRPRPPTAILPAFASVPTALVLLNAQLDGMVALGVGAAVALWSRPFLAGLCLGLALLKPQLMLPAGAALLVTRRGRAAQPTLGFPVGARPQRSRATGQPRGRLCPLRHGLPCGRPGLRGGGSVARGAGRGAGACLAPPRGSQAGRRGHRRRGRAGGPARFADRPGARRGRSCDLGRG